MTLQNVMNAPFLSLKNSFRSFCRSLAQKHIKNNNLNSFACKMKLTHTPSSSHAHIRAHIHRFSSAHDVRLWLTNEYFVQAFSINVAVMCRKALCKMCQNIHEIIRSGALALHAAYIPFHC